MVSRGAAREQGFRRRPPEERENAWRELRATASAGGRYVRAQPLLLLIMGIAFFAGASTESFDRLNEAQFIRNVGLPSIAGLDPVVWFGIFGLGTLVIGLVASEVLVRRFERVGREGLARLLFGVTAAQAGAVLVFALAVCGFWLYYLTRSLASPAYDVWLNENISDSSVRATVISITNQSDAIGQVGGRPALGASARCSGCGRRSSPAGRCSYRRSRCTAVRYDEGSPSSRRSPRKPDPPVLASCLNFDDICLSVFARREMEVCWRRPLLRTGRGCTHAARADALTEGSTSRERTHGPVSPVRARVAQPARRTEALRSHTDDDLRPASERPGKPAPRDTWCRASAAVYLHPPRRRS